MRTMSAHITNAILPDAELKTKISIQYPPSDTQPLSDVGPQSHDGVVLFLRADDNAGVAIIQTPPQY